MITEAFNWWVDGLATAWLGLQGRLRRAKRFRVAGTDWPFVLKPLDNFGSEAAGPIEVPESLSADSLSRIRQRTRGSVFEIAIPAAALLERRLDPLPRESKPYIESVVRHQIEAIFPWSARDVLHAALAQDRSDGRIDVTVRATSRSALEPVLSIAGACEASEVELVGAAEAGHERDLGSIRVPLGEEGSARIERARAVARYAIVALLVTGVCTIAWTSFLRWSAGSELAALERTRADRRALLVRASAAGDAAGHSGLGARRLRGPLAVLVLEKLSELLPDDTYLTDLNLDGERLRISGVSSQAAELVPLLEKSGHFRNASFYAPTTRMAGKPADRFSMEAVVVSQLEARR
jgi:general secretion pathway protein L